jgi:hypothetical protein
MLFFNNCHYTRQKIINFRIDIQAKEQKHESFSIKLEEGGTGNLIYYVN